MVYITRKEYFNAAHKLFNSEWSQEKNYEIFGGCSNPNWHGHNFELHVTVKGIPDPTTGFVINLKELSHIINQHVIKKVDHKNLNLDVDFMEGKMPSCEVFIIEIWKIIAHELPKISPTTQLHSLRLHETNNNYVDYFGE